MVCQSSFKWLSLEWCEKTEIKREHVSFSTECCHFCSVMSPFSLNLLAQRHAYQINAIAPLESGYKVWQMLLF